jgi:hypothetical protein
MYVENKRIRETLLLSELILTAIRGTWFSFTDREKLPVEVIESIEKSGWLPNVRTFQSWNQHWDLEKFLAIRIVPIETLINRQPSTAERYSGYTKGYGQDGNPPAPHRTHDDPVDGDEGLLLPKFTLQEFETYIDILNSIEIQRVRKKNK